MGRERKGNMLNKEQIEYLLQDITGGEHNGEKFCGSLDLVERAGLQIRDLDNGGFRTRTDGLIFLGGIRDELRAMLS